MSALWFDDLRRTRWLRYLLVALGLTLLMAAEDLLVDGDPLAEAVREVPFTFAAMFGGLWLGLLVINALLDWPALARRPPGARRLAEGVCVLTYAAALAVPVGVMFWAAGLNQEEGEGLWHTVQTSMAISAVVNAGLYLTVRYLRLVRERDALRLRSAQLEKEGLDLQYKALRSQVNPHFLFNSLNVLSSLLYADVATADLYIREFARVFRYVLDLNDEPAVALRRELAVLHSYLFMQGIRFGDALRVEIDVSPAVLDHLLPPLSLQLLADNALKHNVVSKSAPLTLRLTATATHVELANTYQPRLVEPGTSTGLGLRNLTQKYALLAAPAPEFGVQGRQYVARLPLLEAEDGGVA